MAYHVGIKKEEEGGGIEKRSGKKEKGGVRRGKEGGSREGGREGVTNVGAGGEGVMKSRASYVGTSAQPCSTCEVTTPVDVQHFMSQQQHPRPPLYQFP